MSKKVSNILIISGAVIKVTDMIRPGTFLNGGILSPLDLFPKFQIGPIQTDLGVWLIAAGVIGRVVK